MALGSLRVGVLMCILKPWSELYLFIYEQIGNLEPVLPAPQSSCQSPLGQVSTNTFTLPAISKATLPAISRKGALTGS